MRFKLWLITGLVLTLTLLAAWIDQAKPVKIAGRTITVHEGLDLQGGTHLVYALEPGERSEQELTTAHQSVIEVIRRRVDAFGVSEPVIQQGRIGETRTVIVELPGITDVQAAKNLIGKTAQLTFWEQQEGANDPASPLGPGWSKTELTGAHLKSARVDIQGGSSRLQSRTEPVVNLELSSDGAKLFEEITSRNVQKPVAIVLDDQVVSAPIVQEKISGGTAVISGIGSVKDAKLLSIQLNAGALPVPISVIEERNVGATLGDESVRRSLAAGLIGLAAVAIFMLVRYRLAGVLATGALLIYSLLVFALFKLIPVTLTLAGIAGFILSIGMAVDANILIFERFREERRAGRSLQAAIEEGFRRAWSSIRDSNISSLLTAAILFYFGTGLVRGFALTLSIGILVSMFTAITVTRTFLKLALREVKV